MMKLYEKLNYYNDLIQLFFYISLLDLYIFCKISTSLVTYLKLNKSLSFFDYFRYYGLAFSLNYAIMWPYSDSESGPGAKKFAHPCFMLCL